MMFYDDPGLVHDMMEHISDFILGVLERTCRDGMLDAVTLNENNDGVVRNSQGSVIIESDQLAFLS